MGDDGPKLERAAFQLVLWEKKIKVAKKIKPAPPPPKYGVVLLFFKYPSLGALQNSGAKKLEGGQRALKEKKQQV